MRRGWRNASAAAQTASECGILHGDAVGGPPRPQLRFPRRGFLPVLAAFPAESEKLGRAPRHELHAALNIERAILSIYGIPLSREIARRKKTVSRDDSRGCKFVTDVRFARERYIGFKCRYECFHVVFAFSLVMRAMKSTLLEALLLTSSEGVPRIRDIYREHLPNGTRETHPADLCPLSRQRFLVLRLDSDNLSAHNHARLAAPALTRNFREVRPTDF